MEKEKESRIYWIIGIIAVILIILINIYSYFKEGESLSSELMVTLVLGILGSGGGIVIFIFTKHTNKKVEDLDDRVENLEDNVLNITNKDIERAEKEVFYYNAMLDLKEGYEARKEIDKLAKKIKRQSKRIIEEEGNFNHNTQSFIIELCNEIAEIIRTEYNFGLDNLDLVDFKKDLESKVETVANKLKGIKEIYKLNTLFNIEKYIIRLSGVQGRENGQRRKLFDNETMSFINLLIKNLENEKIIEDEKLQKI
jgi:translation elongation factor EF-1beta